MDASEQDVSGRTPLHWAAFSRSHNSLEFLIALKADVDAQDKQGLAPLHLAVKVAGPIGSTNDIKSLLVSGANRTIRDAENKKPVDHIDSALQKDIRDQIRKILAKP